MKRRTTYLHRRLALILLVAAILGVGAALAQTGGGYDLTWSTIDGGGSGSAGAGYHLAGTLGQHDAGATLRGGAYSLSGGFWGGVSAGSKLYLPVLRR